MKKRSVRIVAASLLIGFMATGAFAQETVTKKTNKITLVAQDENGKKVTFERSFEGDITPEIKQEMEAFTKGKKILSIDIDKQVEGGHKGTFVGENGEVQIIELQKEGEAQDGDFEFLWKSDGSSGAEDGKQKKMIFLKKDLTENAADGEMLHKQIKVKVDENGEATVLVNGENVDLQEMDGKHIVVKDVPKEVIEKMGNGEKLHKVIKVKADGNGESTFWVNGENVTLEGGNEERIITEEVEQDGDKMIKTITIKIIRKITIEDLGTTDKLPETIANARETELGDQLKDLNYYPNPSEGRFTLSFQLKKKADTNVAIYDLQGRKVYEEKLADFSGTYKNEIDLSQRDKGMYILKVTQGKKALVKKLVVE